MFKKFISLFLIAGMLLTGTSVFAEGTTKAAEAKSKLVAKIQNLKEREAEIKPLLDTIRANRIEVLQLRVDAKTAYNTTKAKVKEMLKNKENLTAEQIETLKQNINVLKQERKQLEGSIGNIKKETVDLKNARKEKDIEALKQSLNNIIDIQKTRIESLKKIIEDMNKIPNV